MKISSFSKRWSEHISAQTKATHVSVYIYIHIHIPLSNLVYICYILSTVQFGDCMLPSFVPNPQNSSASIGSKRRRPLANRKLASSNKRCPPVKPPRVVLRNFQIHPWHIQVLRWKNLSEVESPMRNENIVRIIENVTVFFLIAFIFFENIRLNWRALQRKHTQIRRNTQFPKRQKSQIIFFTFTHPPPAEMEKRSKCRSTAPGPRLRPIGRSAPYRSHD